MTKTHQPPSMKEAYCLALGAKEIDWFQSGITLGGFAVEVEVEYDWKTGMQLHTGRSRYVPA